MFVNIFTPSNIYSASSAQDIQFAGKKSVSKADSVDFDTGLKPVTFKIQLERVDLKVPNEFGEGFYNHASLKMIVDGKPWRFNPYVDESGEICNEGESGLCYKDEISHDILEHILTPWFSPLQSYQGEVLAGRVSGIVNALPEGDMQWQAFLTVHHDESAFSALGKVYEELLTAPAGTRLTMTFKIPPPDRFFKYKERDDNAVVSVCQYGPSQRHPIRVDDYAVPTGHPFKPIELLSFSIRSSRKKEKGKIDNRKAKIEKSVRKFSEEFKAYQAAMGNTLKQQSWKSFLRESIPDFWWDQGVNLLKELLSEDKTTVNGSRWDFRRRAQKRIEKQEDLKLQGVFNPPPALMPVDQKE